jgi:hypothetical protein
MSDSEQQRRVNDVLFTEGDVAYSMREHEAVACVFAREHAVDKMTTVAAFGGRVRDGAVDGRARGRLEALRGECARGGGGCKGRALRQVERAGWLRGGAEVGEGRGVKRSTSALEHVRDTGSPLRRRRRRDGCATTLDIS